MKVYCVEYKSKYCVNGTGHAFTMAKSKADAKKIIDPKTQQYVNAWAATDEDAKKYGGRDRTLEDIRTNLENANAMIKDILAKGMRM